MYNGGITERSNTMYHVYLTNFQYFAQDTFDTIEAATAYGLATGFEFQIYTGPYNNRQLVK
jgi:hypothetical protein